MRKDVILTHSVQHFTKKLVFDRRWKTEDGR